MGVRPCLRDKAFLKKLATIDVLRHLPSLLALAKEQLPHLPVAEVSFSADYSTCHPVLGVLDLRSGGASNSSIDSLGLRFTREVEAKREQGDPSAILIKISFSRNRKEWTCYHSPEIRGRGISMLQGDYVISTSEFPKRQGGCDAEGNSLETCYDDIDEILQQFARSDADGDPPSESAEPKVWRILSLVDQIEDDLMRGRDPSAPYSPPAQSSALDLRNIFHSVSS